MKTHMLIVNRKTFPTQRNTNELRSLFRKKWKFIRLHYGLKRTISLCISQRTREECSDNMLITTTNVWRVCTPFRGFLFKQWTSQLPSSVFAPSELVQAGQNLSVLASEDNPWTASAYYSTAFETVHRKGNWNCTMLLLLLLTPKRCTMPPDTAI